MSANTRPTLDRHYRPTLGRYLGRVSTDTIGRHLGRHSTDISVDSWQDIDRQLVECRPRCRSSMSVEYVGRVCRSRCGPSVDRPSIDRYWRLAILTDIGDTRPTLNRYLGRYSGDILTDTWSSVGRHVLQVGRKSVTTTLRHYTTL